MSHSYARNKISLKDFTPPHGTTKTVLLTLLERKKVARQRLAEHVARLFVAESCRVTIKSFGRYITIAHNGWGFQITNRSIRRSPASESGFRSFPEFVNHLAAFFRPTELLRMAKLIRKQKNDKRSATWKSLK